MCFSSCAKLMMPAAQVCSTVALDDEHPVVHHIQQHLRVKHGRGTDGHPQIAQTVAVSAHHILVQEFMIIGTTDMIWLGIFWISR